ncbi:MAG: hypothetical protein IJ899_07920 [Blautia sp.]|nr:hypothetical protein [Blautia sp.]
MDECKDTWYPFSWYCPNCGTQLIGFKNAEGMIKVECKRCLAVLNTQSNGIRRKG